MKTLSTFALLFNLLLLNGQKTEFGLYFKLRLENQLVYCDVLAKEDYEVLTMQFGIHHNSDQVAFKNLSSNVLVSKHFRFNQICPNNVRIAYVHDPANENLLLKKDSVFMTLEYEELSPSDHFICIMPSASYTCTTMVREVLQNLNTELHEYKTFLDACIEYKIKDGAILLSNESVDAQKPELYYDEASNALVFLNEQHFSDGSWTLEVCDLLGKIQMKDVILPFASSIPIRNIHPGYFVYTIRNENKIIKTASFVKSH